MTFDIEHCTASNRAGAVEDGAEFATRLYPDTNFYFGSSPTGELGIKLTCTVTMDGTDITESVFEPATVGAGDIDIPSVSGPVVITVRANTAPSNSSSSNAPSGSTHNVTLNLSHCTASNTSETTGGTYSNTLTADEGYVFVRSGLLGSVQYGDGDENDIALACTVTMGEDNVTSSVFDISTGEIGIDEVTGDITVTVEEQDLPTN